MPDILIPDRICFMRIRSVTCFLDPSYPLDEQRLNKAGELLQIARYVFVAAGYEIQSARLASVPFPNLLAKLKGSTLTELTQQLEQAAANHGYDYISMGPAFPEQLDSFAVIPEALAATKNAFFAGSMNSTDGQISLEAIHECARVIQQASKISPDGFANMRFAALANVPAGSPFFPAAYHSGGDVSFALATEAADLAVMAFSQAFRLDEARHNLIDAMESNGRTLADLSREVERQSGVRFGGIDFSLAPFPDESRSIGRAMERLGVPVLGDHGSLAAAAILASTIDQAEFPRAGFSGLMLPVLEDVTLAKRAAEGSLGVTDLLLYSAVCGTGLDTIPLPGDTTTEQLSAILLDLACLSSRLGKPLTARLMPIPGKKAGDSTEFDFSYFANSRVMSLKATALDRFLAGSELFTLRPRVRQ